MKRYILYTTASVSKVQRVADDFAVRLMASPGRPTTTIEVRRKVPRGIRTQLTAKGKAVLAWDWFRSTFSKEKYDGVIFHFTPYYRRRWGLSTSVNGSRNPDERSYPEFWVCADLDAKAEGYPPEITELLRILLHEHSHFDEDQDDLLGNLLSQLSVHYLDYDRKLIHRYPELANYQVWVQLEVARQALIGWHGALSALKSLMLFKPKKTLLQAALDHIGLDASPNDLVDDVVGCAESVTTILRTVTTFPLITGTWTLRDELERDTRFTKTGIPMPGDIVISPTGTGNGSIRGHAGIVGRNGSIMSNDSYTGKWMANYTIDTWRARYVTKGGMPTYFYSFK